MTAQVRGHVQGVGFLWAVQARSRELGLVGYAANRDDGRVEVVAEGTQDRLAQLLAWLRGAEPPGRVSAVSERWSQAGGGLTDFVTR